MYKFCFLKQNRDRPFEDLLAESIKIGASNLGDRVDILPISRRAAPVPFYSMMPGWIGNDLPSRIVPLQVAGIPSGFDGYIIFGCKEKCIFDYAKKMNKNIIVLDKGYIRSGSLEDKNTLLRCSVNSFQPEDFLKNQKMTEKRWDKLNIEVKETKVRGNSIIFAGGSQKYCNWHSLGDVTPYAKGVLKEIKNKCKKDRCIIYRPKPGKVGGGAKGGAKKIDGFKYSGAGKLQELLREACNLVTFGSNAAVEAAIHGVPTTILGDGAASLISRGSLDSIEDPYLPTMEEKMQFFYNLSYCQWSRKEFNSGEAWKEVRKQFI